MFSFFGGKTLARLCTKSFGNLKLLAVPICRVGAPLDAPGNLIFGANLSGMNQFAAVACLTSVV
jgi:hypothetical protein